MKIGISAIHVRPGKSGSHQPYLINLVSALSRTETAHQFVLFVTQANQCLFGDARGKMEFVIYPGFVENVPSRILFEQLWLPLDARIRNVDVLHYPGTSASFLATRKDVVTVHQDPISHGMSMSRLKKRYFNMILRHFLKRVGQIIVPSQVYADLLIEYFGYKSDQVMTIHHGVNPMFGNTPNKLIDETREKYGIEKNPILTVANTLPHKNIPNLLNAFNLLLTHYEIENQLVVVGDVQATVLAQLIDQIAKSPRKMKSHVKVIPFLPHEKLPPIYASASVFVFFSRVETFGLPLVEAMACGLPVVASDIPVHREILKNAGLLIPPDRPDLLADALYEIITNKEFRNTQRHSALERSREFSWDRAAQETIRAYERACDFSRKSKSVFGAAQD